MSQPTGRVASDVMNVVLVLCILVVIWLCFGDLIRERLAFRRDRRVIRHYTAEVPRAFPAAPEDIAGPADLTPEEEDRLADLDETFRLSGRKLHR